MTIVAEFILNAAETFFSIHREDIEVNDDYLNDFIHNSHSLLLQVYINNNNVLLFNTKIQGDFCKSIVFYKNLPQVLNTEDALNHINFVTLSTDAAESLYQILKQVYNPLLTIEDNLYFSKLQKNLTDLELNLRILTHDKGVEDIKVILTIDDEVDYWKSVGQKRDANKKEREAASSFCILFEDICEEIRSLQSSTLQEVRDAAENIAGIFDDIWRYTIMPYPENRMVHVFDIIGHTICKVIQKDTSQIDLWKAHNSLKDNEILTILTEGLNVMKTWISACKTLTETYWPNYALHQWKGRPYVPIFCNNFDNRLKEIHNIRSTYNQLTKLLTANEKVEMNSDKFLEPFENINIWICNGPNQPWESAVAKFAGSLRPAEARIAEKLKPRMHNTSTKQMLYEFLRYKTLINRPLVKQALSNELELFVNSLMSMLKNIQSDLESDELDVKMYKPAELSSLVQQVQWAKQCENQVKEIQMCAEQYLSNFENSKTLLNLAPQVLKDLKTLYTQLHEDWIRDVQSLVKQEFAISEDKPVVEFSTDTRLMVVRFEPRLVRAEGEARALAALGLSPPPAINSALQELVAPLKHARTLHQVSSFHNTLGERMIPSTRPMMLAGALELAGLVRDQQPLFWRDECLTQYTRNMKEMVLKLEGQNTYLTSQHLLIRGIVEKLMDTDLLAKQVEWKRSIKEIRDIIEKVEANGYKNTDMWRSHWDLQLYKALECQYIKTLLSLHLHFPNVRVDLVLRGRRVRTMPAIEEVRVQHYSQLRRLLALPAHFVGLRASPVDEKSVFASIIDKYSWLGNKGVTQLEAALRRLRGACARWTRRLALACVDVDALCADHLRTPEHFERNFKACKAYGQAVAKMTFEDEKIEWISVGTLTLRREFEAQARGLWSSVAAALGAGCRADAASLHAFIAAATLALDDAAPRTARDLADLSAQQQALQLKMPEMEKNVEELKRKAHLLRTWGGDASLEDSVRAWGALRDRVRAHQHLFEHQAEIVKANLKGEWENLQSGIEAWVSRWSQAKARLEHTRDVLYAEMSDRCRSVFDGVQQCDKLIADRSQLIEECGKFDMIFEISQPWKEAEDLRNDFITMWSIFKDYNDEYNILADQDWIIFQKKLHLLDDFVQKWRGLLEPYTTITLYLKQEIDKYTDLTAVLKYLRGSYFTEKHWREIFSLIEIEYVNAEALQVQHFLKAATNIKKQMKALQKINSSASNEATIRSTLNELEVWYAGARLVIIYYTDKTKKLIPIVKDYKELITKVEEQQWVVSSVGAEGAAWEARLRAARPLLRAAQHAQRRFLYSSPISPLTSAMSRILQFYT